MANLSKTVRQSAHSPHHKTRISDPVHYYYHFHQCRSCQTNRVSRAAGAIGIAPSIPPFDIAAIKPFRSSEFQIDSFRIPQSEFALFDPPLQPDSPIGIVVLAWLEGDRNRTVDEGKTTQPPDLAGLVARFLAEGVTFGIDLMK
jgi:hypothetical protein